MSYTQLIYHAIIRTKKNEQTLSLEHSEDLYRCIWDIIKNKDSVLYRINGMEEHVHILFSLHPTIALSDFMHDLKEDTSELLKRTDGFEQFTAWSECDAVFTHSLKDKDVVLDYIKNQREHHKTYSFKEEYILLLEEMGIELDKSGWNQ